MDVSTFYALFSATCFTLTGLWWSVVEKHRHWLSDPGMRRRVGSVYLAFLLPALMGDTSSRQYWTMLGKSACVQRPVPTNSCMAFL